MKTGEEKKSKKKKCKKKYILILTNWGVTSTTSPSMSPLAAFYL